MPKADQFVPLFDEGHESAESVAPPQARFPEAPVKIIAQRDDTSLLAQQVLAAGGASDTELSVTLGSSAASDSGAQP